MNLEIILIPLSYFTLLAMAVLALVLIFNYIYDRR